MLAERVLALATLLGGALFLIQARALPFGSAERPGAGFFPVLIAVFACVVGVVATARAFVLAPRAAVARNDPPLAPEQRTRVIVATTPTNLLACFVGVVVGTIVGVLPGIGPVGAMALLLPSTFALDPATALIMLAGIYYGAMYGGSTTSILVNVPGEAGSVVTLLDGYQMTRKGRAGAALAVAAVGSFVAGTVGVVGIMFAASWLADVAVRFGPPEYFAITLGGILLLSRLSSASLTHAFVLVAVGLAVGTIGMNPVSALRRFTYGSVSLSQGVELVPVIMGLYGVAEVLVLAEEGAVRAQIASVRLRELFPTREEWRRSAAPIARGSVVGFLTGLIPGPAAVLSTFISYALEKRVSKTPEKFGTGMIEGVAGPESASNGATAGARVRLLPLGS